MTTTDQLAGKLLEIINQVQSTVTNHSAEAVNLILTSTRIDGICWLGGAFICFAICFLLAFIFIKTKQIGDEAEMPILFLGIGALLSFLFLFYPWNWIQVFNPKLYLAHEIIQEVMK